VAFFCDKTGVRILAPGTSTAGGGEVPAHRGTERCHAAESAAQRALHAQHPHPNEVPGPKGLAAAVTAAREAFQSFCGATSAPVDIALPEPPKARPPAPELLPEPPKVTAPVTAPSPADTAPDHGDDEPPSEPPQASATTRPKKPR
jgi:hypothetical protein